jgi:hypothetical protein
MPIGVLEELETAYLSQKPNQQLTDNKQNVADHPLVEVSCSAG